MRKLIISMAFAIVTTTSLVQAAPVDGQVTKIDTNLSKITLKHGPIKNLDMDEMTMVFTVSDPAMLQTVKVGDKVKFEADRVEGKLTVVKLQKAK